jgi:hypothetical protein
MKIINSLTKVESTVTYTFLDYALFLLGIKIVLYKKYIMSTSKDDYMITKYTGLYKDNKFDIWLETMLDSIIELLLLDNEIKYSVASLSQFKEFLVALGFSALYKRKVPRIDREYVIENEEFILLKKEEFKYSYEKVIKENDSDYGYSEEREHIENIIYLDNINKELIAFLLLELSNYDILTSIPSYLLTTAQKIKGKTPLTMMKFIAAEKNAITTVFLFDYNFRYEKVKELAQTFKILI